jgi:hypothetical protein
MGHADPGGTTVDAVHRSVLLRFPNAAEDIADLLRRGRVLVRAELSLGYSGYEIVPDGYLCREAGRKAWTDNLPTWHVHASPLRQAWAADKTSGPTFNASVNGRRTDHAMAPAIPGMTATPTCSIRRSCRSLKGRHASTSRVSSPQRDRARGGRAPALASKADSWSPRRGHRRAIAKPAMPTNGRCRPAATGCASPRRA